MMTEHVHSPRKTTKRPSALNQHETVMGSFFVHWSLLGFRSGQKSGGLPNRLREQHEMKGLQTGGAAATVACSRELKIKTCWRRP